MPGKKKTQQKKFVKKGSKKQVNKKLNRKLSKKQYKKRRTIKKRGGEGKYGMQTVRHFLKKHMPLGSKNIKSNLFDIKYKLLRLTRDANDCGKENDKKKVEDNSGNSIKGVDDVTCNTIKDKKEQIKNLMDGKVEGKSMSTQAYNLMKSVKGKIHRSGLRNSIFNTPSIISINFYLCLFIYCKKNSSTNDKNIDDEGDALYKDMFLKNFINNPTELENNTKKMQEKIKLLHDEVEKESKGSTPVDSEAMDETVQKNLQQHEEEHERQSSEVTEDIKVITDDVYNLYINYIESICGAEWITNNEDNYLTKYEVNELIKLWPKDIKDSVRDQNSFKNHVNNKEINSGEEQKFIFNLFNTFAGKTLFTIKGDKVGGSCGGEMGNPFRCYIGMMGFVWDINNWDGSAAPFCFLYACFCVLAAVPLCLLGSLFGVAGKE